MAQILKMDKRVYEKSSGRFGTIVKSSGLLGLKNSVAVAFDDGGKGAFFGKSLSGVVSVEDGCDDVPLDIVGAWKRELEEEHCAGLIKDYLALGSHAQEEVRKRWAKATKRSRSKFRV